MVGIVIASHSKLIADGVKELSEQMAPTVPLAVAGGTNDGRIGTDANKIASAIESVYSDDGVIILFDLGSAFMNAEIAIECIDENKAKWIKIVDAPIVEGSVTAAVESSLGRNINQIIKALKPLNLGKIQ